MGAPVTANRTTEAAIRRHAKGLRRAREWCLTVYRDNSLYCSYSECVRTASEAYAEVDALDSVTSVTAIDLTGPEGLRRRWTRDQETGSLTASAW